MVYTFVHRSRINGGYADLTTRLTAKRIKAKVRTLGGDKFRIEDENGKVVKDFDDAYDPAKVSCK